MCGMKLKSYIRGEGLTYQQFAEKINVSSARTVQRYAEGRIPEPNIMRRIVLATGGQVQPNDFFEVEALTK